VFSPAVVSTAVDNLQVNGIVLSRNVLLYLEGLVLLTGCRRTALQCSKGTFRAFLLTGANSPSEHGAFAPHIEGADPPRPVSLV
jgi:hypothetical protein